MDPPPTEAVFGRWLRQRRRSLDLTQKALARQVGCSPATIRKLEADERRPSRQVAGAIARVLGVPDDEHDAFVRFSRAGWAETPPDGGARRDDRPWLAWAEARGRGEALPVPPSVTPPSATAAAPFRTGTRSGERVVGRERELGLLDEALDGALGGAGRVLLVAGEAGQGKTTLLTSFARRALGAHRELLVATGACNAYAAGGDPFQPFREVLQELTGGKAVGDEDAVGAERGPHLQRHLPATWSVLVEAAPVLAGTLLAAAPLVERLRHAGFSPPDWLAQRAATPAGHDGVGGSSHVALRSAITAMVCGVAERVPVLILLDDLQWVDESSADALLHLARSVAGHPALVVGAYRPSDIVNPPRASRHVMQQVLHEVERVRAGSVVDLDGADGRSFLDAWLDSEPNRLGEAFREALWQQTGGQPLFTVELLRAMQERGELTKDEEGRWEVSGDLRWAALPDRVAGVLAERIDRIDPEARQVLRVASIEGEAFTAEVVAAVLGREPRDVTRLAGEELYHRRALVVPLDMRRGASGLVSRYRFRHNLIQRFVYESVDEAERAYLHEAVGDALEQLFGDDADAVAVAEHFLEAHAPQRAGPHLGKAGERARMSGALSQAVGYYRAALERWTSAGRLERAAMLRDLGECECMRGNLEASREALDEARAIFVAEGETRAASAALALMGHVMYEGQDYARGLEACTRAATALEGAPESPELAMALSMRALLHMMMHAFDQSLQDGRRALDLATRLHAGDARLRALLTVGTVLSHGPPERQEEGLGMLEESFREADRLGVEHFASASLGNRGGHLIAMGRIEEGRETLQRAVDYAHERGIGLHEASWAGELWQLTWMEGRWSDALAQVPRLRELTADVATLDRNRTSVPVYLASASLDLGRPQDAQATFDLYRPSLERTEEAGFLAIYLRERLRLAAMRGELELADAHAAELMEVLTRGRLYPDADPLLTLCRWLAYRKGPHSGRSLTACVETLRDLERFEGGPLTSAALQEAEAVAAEARGDMAAAAGSALAAADGWRSVGFLLPAARATALAGRALAHAGEAAEAGKARTAAEERLDGLSRELPDGPLRASFASVRRTMLEGDAFVG